MPYTEQYESELLRGDTDPAPWDLHEEIGHIIRVSHRVLDVGCGTASKTLKFAPQVQYVVGVEPNLHMRRRARENTATAGIRNLFLTAGTAGHLPFKDQSFDVVTVMVAPHDTQEICRVLKPRGFAILEKIGDRDKLNIKLEFRDDERGSRGQFTDWKQGTRADRLTQELSACFRCIEVQEGFWKTYYTLEGMQMLLEQTPAVRDFDSQRDAPVLRRIQQLYQTGRGIETTQHRILIRACK